MPAPDPLTPLVHSFIFYDERDDIERCWLDITPFASVSGRAAEWGGKLMFQTTGNIRRSATMYSSTMVRCYRNGLGKLSSEPSTIGPCREPISG